MVEEEEEQIDTSSKKKPIKDRDLFNIDGTSGEETKQPESEDEELDISQIEPSKVNWFKYILDKYL